MTTGEGGAVAIWHDIAPEGLDEFYAWHGEEHMPERVAIPGFIRGRRFVASNADLGFFNLYETASPDVVRGPDYRARLDAPTPRTLSAVKHFRNVARSLCRIVLAQGNGEGGHVATLRYDVADEDEARHVERFAEVVFPAFAGLPGIAALRLLVADRAASGYVNAEQRMRGTANLVPPVVLVVEGWADEGAFEQIVRQRLTEAPLAANGLTGEAVLGFYRHQLTVSRPPAG